MGPSHGGNAARGWRAALLGLVALTLLRLAVAAVVPLSPDEAYYWLWSRALAPGYLDHPPMVALWIRAGTALCGETRLGLRLLGPISAALGTILLAGAAEDLFPNRGAGLRAGMLLNATLLLSVGAVVMTPDTPLIFFWTAALAAAARLLRTGDMRWWLGFGLAAGLALDSKYTAGLLGIGIVLWLAVTPLGRHSLHRWPLWAGGALAVTAFTPVLAWNAAHHWASFLRQGGRTGAWDPHRALGHLGELVGGQAGLATPLVFLLLLLGLGRSLRAALRGSTPEAPAEALLAVLTWPTALLFLQHALGDRVQANWPAVIYPAGLIAAALVPGRLWRPAVALGLVLSLLVYLQAAAAPLALPRSLDFTLIRLAGWHDLAQAADAARRSAGGRFIAADDYGLAAELAWELPTTPIVGAEPRWALFALRAAPVAGQSGLLIRSLRRADPPAPGEWASISEVGTAERRRGGIVAERYRLYRVIARPGASPLVLLPARRSRTSG